MTRVVIAFFVGLLTGAASWTGPATVDDLAWLAGCWASVGGEAGSGEHWMAPAGGTLLGVNRTVKDSKTVAHEFLQIRESEAGGLELGAWPSGQTEAVFGLVSLEERRVVFENSAHDFPQRIIYHLKDDGSLEGRIEGEVEGQSRVVVFPFRRVDCVPEDSEPKN